MLIDTLRLRHRNFINYSYIVFNQDTLAAVLVDPAWQPDTITERLTELNASVSAILLSHSHYDHVNLSDRLANVYNAAVLMSKQEIDYYHFKCKNLIAIDTESEFELNHIVVQPFQTPGHTKGSLCFQVGSNLFTGDTLFSEGCGTCECLGGNPHEMYESIQKIKAVVDPETRIFPGHCYGQAPGMQLDVLKTLNIYLSLEDKERFVSFRMRPYQPALLNFV